MERAVRCSFAAAATSANDTDAPRRSPCRRRPIPYSFHRIHCLSGQSGFPRFVSLERTRSGAAARGSVTSSEETRASRTSGWSDERSRTGGSGGIEKPPSPLPPRRLPTSRCCRRSPACRGGRGTASSRRPRPPPSPPERGPAGRDRAGRASPRAGRRRGRRRAGRRGCCKRRSDDPARQPLQPLHQPHHDEEGRDRSPLLGEPAEVELVDRRPPVDNEGYEGDGNRGEVDDVEPALPGGEDPLRARMRAWSPSDPAHRS